MNLFWRDNAGSRPMSASGDKAAVAFKVDTIYENAYMLRYEKVTESSKLVASVCMQYVVNALIRYSFASLLLLVHRFSSLFHCL